MAQATEKHTCDKNKFFVAKESVSSVTKNVTSIIVNKNLCFIDSPGFNDPDPTLGDSELWLRLCEWFRIEQNDIFKHGYAGFINIVSVPVSKRPSKDHYMNVAKLLMSLSLVYPTFPVEDLKQGHFPAIYTILTNFSPLVVS